MGPIRRQPILALLFTFLLLYGTVSRPPPTTQSLPPQDLQDLYWILQHEARINSSGNVYKTLGNQLQLEGKSYSSLLKALNSYDLLLLISKVRSSGPSREEEIDRALVRTREAFAAAVRELPWPGLQARVREDRIELDTPSRLTLYGGIPQWILFRVQNQTSSPRSLQLLCPALNPSSPVLKLLGQQTRFLALRSGGQTPTPVSIRLKAGSLSVEKEIPVQIQETGVLEGRLLEGGKPTAGRVRITDERGRYWPLERQDFGLVVQPRRMAQRWAYADGVFRVRAPAGPLRISVRRGLEYRKLEKTVRIENGQTLRQDFPLHRWTDPERRGWYSGDTHAHMLDPPSALFEMRAEDLRVLNILVFEHWGLTTVRPYFQGAVNPISDSRHLIYYNEEYRNHPLGHVGLLNLKSLIEPVSTGSLAIRRPQFHRYAFYSPGAGPTFPRRGNADSPDYPLLIEVMREAQRQGALVNWAHLRPHQWEFPIDAALGGIDTVDILTHTRFPDALDLWYDLLNCGLRLPATAGTDRIGPEEPVGHQRVYVRVASPFTYQRWIDGLKKGASFVSNGPMVFLTVGGHEPGTDLKWKAPQRVRIQAEATSEIPFERLEIVRNGQVIASESSPDGKMAQLSLETTLNETSWIAARCLGGKSSELFWSHPVFAHTNPVFIDVRDQRLAIAESACSLLDFMGKLEDWVEQEAYFRDSKQKEAVRRTLSKGLRFYRVICGRETSGQAEHD